MTSYTDVSVEECDEIRQLHDDGLTLAAIRDEVGRAYSTVRRHANDACNHKQDLPCRIKLTTETITENVNELAESIGRIPSQADWDCWDRRPWSAATVCRTIDGGWPRVLELSELPAVAPDCPEKIRETAYQKPELTRMPDGDGGDGSHA